MRSRVDALLGRVSMYRLVDFCLLLLVVFSLIAAGFGAVGYSVVAMVVTLELLLVVTYVSNAGFARLFGVTAHAESSVITALLLFFILRPSTDLVALGQIALAGIFASASKYLLAVHGRHIFNPAAVGAVWLAICHVYVAFWWVGSPALLPITAALALVVLYRTRRGPLATVFVGVAGSILVLRSLSAGADPMTALTFAFAQTPLVFFVGFMLCEPLTLPPQRWQQLTVAAVVGVLFAVPLSLGAVAIGPETALVVGNALAFLLGRRRGIDLVLTGRRRVSSTATEFAFRPTRAVAFRAGQYLELGVPHDSPDSRGARRSFSITSPPRESDELRIALKIPERASSYKRALTELEVGSTLTATTIAGDFLLPKDPSVPLLLIAGGIGITPFVSQLADIADPDRRDIVLVYVVSDPSDVAFADILERSGARVFVVTAHGADRVPAAFQARTSSILGRTELSYLVPDIAARRVYVSGPPDMVTSAAAAARKLGVRRVRRDYFTGY